MAGEFGPDGTQALPPLPVYPDALSGLAAASFTDPATWSASFDEVPDTVVPPPVPLVPTNQQQVRAAAQRELARDRARRPAPPPYQPTPLPPAAGLPYTRSAPTIGLQAAGGLPPAPSAVQQTQRKNAAAGCIGCAVVLVFVFIVLVVVVVAVGSQP
ncbi:hypothetical protein [Kutzneria sp. NPDC052558]|uniref:hypothetical protein n=1 Tax=Kutzneria sp. NPDC052558 TaxID=3364121 RepID=UPI0037C97C5B